MKSLLLLLTVCLYTDYHLWAQASKTFRIKAGQVAEKVIPISEKYRYKEFRSGKVTYNNDKSSPAKLNYNILLGEMQIIDPKGDTLSLANEQAIKKITIGEDCYTYDHENGFMETIAQYHALKLVVNQKVRIIRSEKVVAYGQSSAISSVRTYSSISTTNSQVFRLETQADLILSKDISYFMVDRNGHFYPIYKASIFKMFPDHKKTIGFFLKENHINFTKEEDMKKLTEFCSQLS